MPNQQTLKLFSSLQQGGLLLCANLRLSRTYREAYDQWMLSNGHQAWSVPRMVEIRRWAQETLAKHLDGAPILTAAQAHHLWESCIRQNELPDRLALLQIAATAKTAHQAHTLLAEYRVTFTSSMATPDQLAFLRWREAYRQAIKHEGWIDPAEIFSRLLVCIQQGQVREQTVWLAGFDEFTPIQQQLNDALASAGCTVQVCAMPAVGLQRSLLSFEDRDTEIRAAAQWAQASATSADHSLAIVAVDPSYLPQIERILCEEIDPLSLFHPRRQESRFDFSQGRMLADEGPIHAALELLSFDGEIEIDRWSWLLRTPYVGGHDEMSARLQLDRFLRDTASGSLRLSDVKQLAGSFKAVHRCQTLFDHLAILDQPPRQRRGPAEWVLDFDQQLQQMGWPGSRSISSREYQALKSWRDKLLPSMASLQVVGQRLSRSEAVATLRRLAVEMPFQMETPQSPIQVMGVLEAGGLQFDGVWVLGATEMQFPAPPAPNPFIPLSVQTAKQMPHCDHAREHAYAVKVVRRLADCAPEVVFSLPQWQGSEPQRPSPLLAALLPDVELSPSAPDPSPLLRFYDSKQALEWCDEAPAPRLTEATYIRGGTGVLKDQGQCPFRAYAHYRIGVTALGENPLGLAMSVRGSLVHQVLERFWSECQSSQQLCLRDQQTLTTQLEEIVRQILSEPSTRMRIPSAMTRSLEGKRLVEVGLQWLLWEQKRSAFVVEQTEARHEITLHNLRLKTTLDRVDRLEEGGERILIDYKTGISRAAQLAPARMEEPQLPLYTRTLDPPPQGVALAQVRRHKPAFSGICQQSGWLPGVPGLDQAKGQKDFGANDWPSLLDQWAQLLDQLAEDFCQGDARVAPVDGDKTCTWCDLRPLCRICESNEALS